MATATLGGLIKDYRIKKRLSQQEVSIRIGWKDTSRLSKIEQGRVGKPNRNTIEKIIKALELDENEKGDFLLVGSFLPTDEELENMKNFCKDIIHKWEYPAYLIDFSWRVLDSNSKTFQIFQQKLDETESFIDKKPNLLEIPFILSRTVPVASKKGDNQESLRTIYQVAQIAKFKLEQKGREKEKWYKAIIKTLMKYQDFRVLWPVTELKDYDKRLMDYEYKVIDWLNKDVTFKFHIFYSKIVQDSRFQTVLYLPADDFTRECWAGTKP